MVERAISVGVLLYDGADELSVGGLWEVIGVWRLHSAHQIGLTGVGLGRESVRCLGGVEIVVESAVPGLAPLLLFVPDGEPGDERGALEVMIADCRARGSAIHDLRRACASEAGLSFRNAGASVNVALSVIEELDGVATAASIRKTIEYTPG